MRQIELKRLAQAADERWASKPSVLDQPRADSERLLVRDSVETGEAKHERSEEDEPKVTGERKDSPGKENPGNPGERWQPQAWTPGTLKR